MHDKITDELLRDGTIFGDAYYGNGEDDAVVFDRSDVRDVVREVLCAARRVL